MSGLEMISRALRRNGRLTLRRVAVIDGSHEASRLEWRRLRRRAARAKDRQLILGQGLGWKQVERARACSSSEALPGQEDCRQVSCRWPYPWPGRSSCPAGQASRPAVDGCKENRCPDEARALAKSTGMIDRQGSRLRRPRRQGPPDGKIGRCIGIRLPERDNGVKRHAGDRTGLVPPKARLGRSTHALCEAAGCKSTMIEFRPM